MDQGTEKLIVSAAAGWDFAESLISNYAFSVLGALLIFVFGILFAGLLQRWVKHMLGEVCGLDVTLTSFLSKLARYAVLMLVCVSILAQFGVQTASIVAMLGAAGLAIGLALQGTLQNVAAGLMLLLLKPFNVGDYVVASGVAGHVESLGVFATEFKTDGGLLVVAPNSSLWNTFVTNHSRNEMRRNEVTISIRADDDIDRAQETMIEIAKADERVLDTPLPEAFVSSLDGCAVEMTLHYWVATPDWWQVSCDMNKAVRQTFNASGFTTPYPRYEISQLPADKRVRLPAASTKREQLA
ncbi:mechanosensitive ion channel domain-containing protein [Nitratireductor sp. GISD-1A_MAKvit]|uniref:mechanosensitive ion channel family protein n=1 Tax=Nitratireductor sp. GISD-1A_MAKvit TaxID=3234198 RepID=UPI003465A48E